jgi:hypothetical protein
VRPRFGLTAAAATFSTRIKPLLFSFAIELAVDVVTEPVAATVDAAAVEAPALLELA